MFRAAKESRSAHNGIMIPTQLRKVSCLCAFTTKNYHNWEKPCLEQQKNHVLPILAYNFTQLLAWNKINGKL